jgi:hypothetical protein
VGARSGRSSWFEHSPRTSHFVKASGRLKPAADEAALADFCITSIRGAMLLGKIRRDRRTVDLAIGHVLAHLSTFRRS